MPVVGKSRVWGRWYTTIPESVRKILDLRKGEEIEWVLVEPMTIVVRKAQKRGVGRDESGT